MSGADFEEIVVVVECLDEFRGTSCPANVGGKLTQLLGRESVLIVQLAILGQFRDNLFVDVPRSRKTHTHKQNKTKQKRVSKPI